MTISTRGNGASPLDRTGSRHIGLFVRSFGGGGGAERVMLNLATALAGRDYRVDLVMGQKNGHFLDEIPDTVNIVELRPLSTQRLFAALRHMRYISGRLGSHVFNRKAAWILGTVPALAAYLNTQRPTVLLSALNYPNIAALLARRLSAQPPRLVISVHNHLSTVAARAPHERRVPRLARWFYPEADRSVAVSDGVADDLAQVIDVPRSRITTIYNPIFRPEILRQAQARLDHAWFAPGAPQVILGIGKLKPQKDFTRLIRAFARVRAMRPARLLILGEGPQRNALLSLARALKVEKDIALPGFVANPFAYIGRAAVFVLSSAWEGLSNVIIEALACGCPVVSTDCPSGPAEILDGGRYGRLVPVGDDAALAEAIVASLDHPLPPGRLRDRARLFSVDCAVERYLDVLLGD